MTSTETTMYELGQLSRAIWPNGDMPLGLQKKVLVLPATGLGLILKNPTAKRALRYSWPNVQRIIDRLPPDLSDPPGGVRIEDQGHFWTGWYHYMSALDRARKLGPSHLERAGKLLFGDRWQSDLARAIGVGDRRVREWMAGDRKPPAGAWSDIAALLRQRSHEGLALLRELDA